MTPVARWHNHCNRHLFTCWNLHAGTQVNNVLFTPVIIPYTASCIIQYRVCFQATGKRCYNQSINQSDLCSAISSKQMGVALHNICHFHPQILICTERDVTDFFILWPVSAATSLQCILMRPHTCCTDAREMPLVRGSFRKFCNSTIKKNGNVTTTLYFSIKSPLSSVHLQHFSGRLLIPLK